MAEDTSLSGPSCPLFPPATTHGGVTTAQMPPGGAKQRLEGRDTWQNLLSRVLSTCGSFKFPLPFPVLSSQDDSTVLSSHSLSRQENTQCHAFQVLC